MSQVNLQERAYASDRRMSAPRVAFTAGQRVPHVNGPLPFRLRSLVRAMRPHQWAKNVLVFVPLAASHQFARIDLWFAATATFVVFCLAASAIYLLNDILDLEADRAHPRKRTRPFAAGELSIPFGIAAALTLLASAMLVALFATSLQLAAVVLGYVFATMTYSLALKRRPVADVFALTGLYVLRILAGGVATGIILSSWLLGFALFFFLSLAFVKRYSEVAASEGWIAGRAYCHDDAMWMHAVGTSVGYMAVLVLALYVNAPDTAGLYTRPTVLWLLCPLLLFWVTRLWFRAGRRVVHDDPVVETLRDTASWTTAAAALGILLAAL
ncbi:MAG TPA: UbiA family prenyltransferase [Vicinamibacterales bacterium]|nr:UbiA family prenyltransferase [Vicinamibacterales bacterium]